MGNFIFKLPLFNYVQNVNSGTPDIFLRQQGDWIATGFNVGTATSINGFLYTITRSLGTGVSLSGLVGISTSIGPNGLFPYEINNNFLNSNVGSGKTIGFSFSISKVFTSTGTGATNHIYATSNSSYTMLPGQTYYAGIYISSASTAGTVYFHGQNSSNMELSGGAVHLKNWYQNVTGVGKTHLNIPNNDSSPLVITPYFYDGTSYQYFPIAHATSDFSKTYADPTREWGCSFELKDLGVQEIEVVGVEVQMQRIYNLNNLLECKIYDGYNPTNVVATAITESTNNMGDRNFAGSLRFYFVPSVTIVPNYNYLVGIALTGSGTKDANDNMYYEYATEVNSPHYNVGIYKTSYGSGFIQMPYSRFPITLLCKSTRPRTEMVGFF